VKGTRIGAVLRVFEKVENCKTRIARVLIEDYRAARQVGLRKAPKFDVFPPTGDQLVRIKRSKLRTEDVVLADMGGEKPEFVRDLRF
jgi:hypothetical protein